MDNLDVIETDYDVSLPIEVSNEKRGFVGKAYVYDEEIYINTNTGDGYDRVVEKMKDFIEWYASRIRLSGFDKEDIKQLMYMILLDGIRRYNPEKHIKLSSFLYTHIKNRIATRIKEENRQSLNATYNESFYKFVCPCGTSFIATKKDGMTINCGNCKRKINDEWKIRLKQFKPISLDMLVMSKNEEEDKIYGRELDNGFFENNTKNLNDMIENVKDLDVLLKNENPLTRKIAELIYYKDYSITDIAQESGLSCWAVSLRLKKLKQKKNIREFFLNR